MHSIINASMLHSPFSETNKNPFISHLFKFKPNSKPDEAEELLCSEYFKYTLEKNNNVLLCIWSQLSFLPLAKTSQKNTRPGAHLAISLSQHLKKEQRHAIFALACKQKRVVQR